MPEEKSKNGGINIRTAFRYVGLGLALVAVAPAVPGWHEIVKGFQSMTGSKANNVKYHHAKGRFATLKGIVEESGEWDNQHKDRILRHPKEPKPDGLDYTLRLDCREDCSETLHVERLQYCGGKVVSADYAICILAQGPDAPIFSRDTRTGYEMFASAILTGNPYQRNPIDGLYRLEGKNIPRGNLNPDPNRRVSDIGTDETNAFLDAVITGFAAGGYREVTNPTKDSEMDKLRSLPDGVAWNNPNQE
jgi:hypothetical protein